MDKTILEQKADELQKIMNHPEFEKLLAEIDAVPAEERLNYAMQVATPEELKKRGIPITDDFKVSPRIFEGKKISKEFEDSARHQLRSVKSGEFDPVQGPIVYTLCFGALVTFGISWEGSAL